MDNSRLPSISQLSLPPLQRQNALSANAPEWGHHGVQGGNWGGYAGDFGYGFGAPGPFKENTHVHENIQHHPPPLPFPPYPTSNHHDHPLPPILSDDEHALPLPGEGILAAVKAKAKALSNLKPAPKVGGVRVTKPKKKVRVVKNDDMSKPGRGRPKGAAGFGADETNKILDLVEINQPIGQQGWDKVTAEYNEWAAGEGHMVRTAQSIDKKFKTLVNTKKPTGTGVKPTQISRAQEIDAAIRSDNYISFVEDGNDADIEIDSSSDSDASVKIVSKVVSAVAQRAARPPS